MAMEVYTFSFPRPQNLCLPSSMLKYIPQTWSPDVYQKLTLTSKHFFATHRILVIPNLNLEYFNNQPFARFWLYEDHICTLKNHYLNLESAKFWIKDYCQLEFQHKSVSLICKALYSNKPTTASIDLQDCYIKYEEFKVLTEHFIKLSMRRCVVQNIDGSFTSLGDIMAVIPNILELSYQSPQIAYINFRQSSTKAIPFLPNLTQFSFWCESVNPNDFCEFVRLHPGRKFKSYGSPDAAYVKPIITALRLKFPQGVAIKPDKYFRKQWIFKFETTIIEIWYCNP